MDYKRFSILIIFGIILSGFMLIYNFIPEKLHSFISRFFIWETTLKIIFSDLKIFLIGGGTETLTYFFNNFKSEYIYIFENLGYTADRPHNLLLNLFYHFGIGGLVLISYLYYKVFSNIKSPHLTKEGARGWSLILIFIFLLLNPTNIVIYLLIILLLANLYTNFLPPEGGKIRMGEKIFLLIITIISIYGAYSSYNFYYSQTKAYNNQFIQASEIYKYNPNNFFYTGNIKKGLEISMFKTPEYYYTLLQISDNPLELCGKYVSQYNFAESYFFCGDLFWESGNKKIAKNFYKSGLELLPDLWNKNSDYYNTFLVKNLKINGNRFLSDKYGLAKILERIGIFNK